MVKVPPLKIPRRKAKRFSWRKILGYASLFLLIFQLLKLLGRRFSFK